MVITGKPTRQNFNRGLLGGLTGVITHLLSSLYWITTHVSTTLVNSVGIRYRKLLPLFLLPLVGTFQTTPTISILFSLPLFTLGCTIYRYMLPDLQAVFHMLKGADPCLVHLPEDDLSSISPDYDVLRTTVNNRPRLCPLP